MNNFDNRNPRIRQARLKRRYNNKWFKTLCVIAAQTLLAFGVVLLVMRNSWGWTLIGFAAAPMMMLFWIKNALATIQIGPTEDFTDLLSEDLLLLLGPDTTPRDLIEILPKTKGGLFMMTRFELFAPILTQVQEFFPPTMDLVAEIARRIRMQTNSEEISGAVMLVALIASIPGYESLLSQLRLEPQDLEAGVVWFNYLNGVMEDAKKPTRSGGIGRDFAFGYTPTLQRFAVNLSERYGGAKTKLQHEAQTAIIKQMIETFTKGGRQNVALVGEYGCGRSTLVNVFAETLMSGDNSVPRSLKYRQIYSLDAPSLISAAKGAGELEHLMINIFNEIYSAQNVILCLDNAHLFFEEGPGSVDIANLLVPILEAGSIRMILIMDEQKFLEISRQNSALANALNKIVVTPMGEDETLKVLMDQAPVLEYQKNVIYTYLALLDSYRLAEQYIHDVEMPGKAKLLMESAASYAENGLVTAEAVATAVEKSYGVKVKVASEAEERKNLLNLEDLIHERMVDQTEAVSAVAHALRRAAAGVKNTGRPIGTFLFLGPTGVGKTELAKTLSEVYFGGEGNLVRLDLNEFVEAKDVARLTRDGAEDAMSLTAQVAKHPFSVILLDEIEKAHSSVLTTLLQVLDEGILRDEKNREISFRDSIIIATSNAGANEIREKISAGEQIEDFREEFVDKLIESGEFKPEFLNRFDEICLFKPLSKEDLSQVLDLIIAGVNKTLEPQKVTVSLTPEAKEILIERGYDPRMGARPMRRVVQKTVENVVAEAILSGRATPGATLQITAEEVSEK